MFIKIKTHPQSKEEKILKKSEDSFEVYVKEKAERGLANKAVIKVLAAYFKMPASKIRLIQGAKSRSKIYEKQD